MASDNSHWFADSTPNALDSLEHGRMQLAVNAAIDALPEVVRAEMSGWVGQADARIAAVAALQGLSESLPSSSN